MANFLLAAAFGLQGSAGVVDPTIDGLSGAISSADGLVLGDPESGIGGSGISLALARNLREKAVVTGSLTLPPSDLIGTLVETLGITIPAKGNGATASPADAEYKPLPGIDALLQAVGWEGANWTSGDGYIYTPASAQRISGKIWLWDDDGGPDQALVVVLKDIIGNWGIGSNPAQLGTFSFDLGATYERHAVEALPTFDYTTQATLSAPTVEEVGFTWGAVRDFTAMQVNGNNETETLPRSNVSGGQVTRQTGRTIAIEAGVLVRDADLKYELDELRREGAATDELAWTVGDPAGAAETINAWRFRAPTPELVSLEPARSGQDALYNASLNAKSTVAGGEAQLIFL